MTNETVTKSKRFYCVSLTPDVCKTPVGASTPPLPYTIIGEFSDATGASPNVKSHSESVVLHGRTTIPSVKGDAAGSAGGVKSGTVGKQVDTKSFSPIHHANGADLVQVGREVWMNARNTIGKIYERGGETARPKLAALSKRIYEEIADARESLESAAQDYQDDYSSDLHAAGEHMMDAGGKMATVGGAVAGTGALMSTTGIGAVAGAPTAAVGAAVTGAGGATMTGGAIVETAATVLDQGANYILTGKVPDLIQAALDSATGLAQGLVLNRLGPVGRWLSSTSKGAGKSAKLLSPGKKQQAPDTSKSPSGPPAKHGDDGKSKGRKEPKSEPPSECCPKNKGPGNKPVKGKKPIHFGTGQEVLHQTDFVTTGVMPIDWTRCYRSGAETEDWGMLGARWSSAFTTSVSLSEQGCVFHDETGRALRLPHLAPGQSHDELKEGFILTREDAESFSLTWRDGSRDRFLRSADGCLPHGYDGVNPMLDAGAQLRVERFVLARSTARDGQGIDISVWAEALPGELLLRVTSDDGTVLEAMREEVPTTVRNDYAGLGGVHTRLPDADGRPRIGRVEEVLENGTRICHVRYGYALDPASGAELPAARGSQPGTILPARSVNLVSQTDVLGHIRNYDYHHHLLTACTSYTGFSQTLEWMSLTALRARWAGSRLDDAALAVEYPITRDNSYQARAIASRAADGSEGAGLSIRYLDIDTSRVCENGDTLDYTFDANWLVTRISRVVDGTTKSLGRREWDRNGMLLAEIDSMGRSTRFAYDAEGNLTSSTDAAGHTSRIAYNEANKPVSITDPMGHTSTRTYDAAGRLASVTNALGHTTAYRYNDKGRLVEQIDAKGGVSRFEYDKGGRLRTSIDCSGFATKYRYDERGRIAAVIGAEAAPGEQTRYAYDALGRLISLTRPDGAVERYGYDADDNLLSHTDAMGHQTHFSYNGQGLLTERIDALGQKVRYQYDSALRLVELVNAKGERYLLGYDLDGRLTSETGFDGKTTSYVYDKAGELTASECAGKRTELIRDSRGLLVAKINADGIVRFAYDELGRMVAVAAPQAEHRFSYDALGQLIEERAAYYLVALPAVPAVDGSRVPDAAFVMTHAYDELGNRIRTTLPNGRRVDTLRYGSGHWHGTLWQGESIVDVERDGRHRERKRRIGRGNSARRLAATREYDPQSRVTRMTLGFASDRTKVRALRDRAFSHDAAGNLLTIAHEVYVDDLGTFCYSYDPVGQLLSATQPELIETFRIDPAGNLLDPAPASINANQHAAWPIETTVPQTITGDLLNTIFGHSYRYDVQGNVISKRSISGSSRNERLVSELFFEYDADNRLRHSVRTQEHQRHTAEYFYDAFSRRIAKRVNSKEWMQGQDLEHHFPTRDSTVTTLFIWDSDMVAQELSTDETLTYLYEPDSFVPMVRIASQCGYSSSKQIVEPPSTSTYALNGPERAAIPPLHTSPSIHNSCAIPSRNLEHIDSWHVKQWDISGGSNELDPVKQENIPQRDQAKYLMNWQNRQENESIYAPNDRICYYNCDHLGTPCELVDDVGEILWKSRTRAWGRSLNSHGFTASQVGNEVEQPIRFQGQYEDKETGLFYNRYRFFDPDSARYVTQDPVGLLGGLNLYAYAPNPVFWNDPNGLAKRKRGCDPCCGKDPASKARSWQGAEPYFGIDSYKNVVMKKGTVLYTLYPHGTEPGNYFSKGAAVAGLKSARNYNDKMQVAHRDNWDSPRAREMRTKLHAYVLKEDTCMAIGVTRNNPHLGEGGGIQHFIENIDKKNLADTGKIISLGRK